jgi:hypothetical protein
LSFLGEVPRERGAHPLQHSDQKGVVLHDGGLDQSTFLQSQLTVIVLSASSPEEMAAPSARCA